MQLYMHYVIDTALIRGLMRLLLITLPSSTPTQQALNTIIPTFMQTGSPHIILLYTLSLSLSTSAHSETIV